MKIYREKSAFQWFTPLLSQRLVLCSEPCSDICPVHICGAELEVEQPGMYPAAIWDASVCYSTDPSALILFERLTEGQRTAVP